MPGRGTRLRDNGAELRMCRAMVPSPLGVPRNGPGPRVLPLFFILVFAGIPLASLAASDKVDPMNPDPPYMTSSLPTDDAIAVRLYALIDIRFSIPMNKANTFVFIQPPIALTRVWIDSMRLWATHEDFAPCT